MQFDPENPVVKLCAQGMQLEGEGRKEEAQELFLQAWQMATSDFEKFTAAHYVARHQKSISEKLQWDQLTLTHALKIDDESIKTALPSLYLNIAKCFEDLHDTANALKNYELADSFVQHLPDDGYGKMIRGGILNGIARVKQ